MRFVALVALLAACERADDPGAAHLVMPPHVDIVMFEPGREPRASLLSPPVSGRIREELVVTTTFHGMPDRHLREIATSEAVVDGPRIHHRQRIESIAVDPQPE